MIGTSMSGCDPLTHAHTYMNDMNTAIDQLRLESEARVSAESSGVEDARPGLFVRYTRVLQSMRMHEVVFIS